MENTDDLLDILNTEYCESLGSVEYNDELQGSDIASFVEKINQNIIQEMYSILNDAIDNGLYGVMDNANDATETVSQSFPITYHGFIRPLLARVGDASSGIYSYNNTFDFDGYFLDFNEYLENLRRATKEEVSDIGVRNIYYFITEFINRFDTADGGYFSGFGYEFSSGYSAFLLPENKSSQEGYKLYDDLAITFVDAGGLEVDKLNTNTTADFTEESIISSVFEQSLGHVIDILKAYGIIE